MQQKLLLTSAACATLVLLSCSGGLELLFGNKKQHDLDLPEGTAGADGSSGKVRSVLAETRCQQQHYLAHAPKSMLLMLPQWTVGALLPWLREKLLTERPELFMKGNSV
jgi:hypothetical protein